MKKIYLLLFITAGIIFCAQAQPFQKGDKLLGGSIGYLLQKSTYTSPIPATNSSSDSRYISFNVSPSIGFFTKPNRLTGFSLSYGYGSNLSSSSNYKDRQNVYGAGIYRQYWNNLGKSFYFIIQGKTGVNYYSQFNETVSNSQNNKNKTIDAYLSVDPGFAYRIKKRLILDLYYSNFLAADFVYNRSELYNTQNSKTYSFRANTGLQNFSLNNFLFGFRYLL